MLDTYLRRAVLFYESGSIRIGIVVSGHDTRLEILDTAGTRCSLPPTRIALVGKESLASDDPSASLSCFYIEVTANIPDEADLYARLAGLPEPVSFNTVLDKAEVTSEAGRFALFIALRTAKLYFSHKNDLYRGLSEEERAQKMEAAASREAREAYLDGVRSFIRQMELSTSNTAVLPEAVHLDTLTQELRALQMNQAVHDLAAIISNWDIPASFEKKITSLRIALGELAPDTDPVLAASGLPVGFVSWQEGSIPPRDISLQPCIDAFTIDDASTRDYDDAFSLVRNGAGWILGIHITNLASRVPMGAPAYNIARERVSSLYLPSQTVNMLPDALSNEVFSLTAGSVHPGLSCYLELDNEFMPTGWRFCADIVRISHNYTYEDMDARIADEPFCHISSIANKLRALRTGSEQSEKDAYSFYLQVKNGIVDIRRIWHLSPARMCVEELMVQYNRSAAEMARQHRLPVIHRNISVTETGPDGYSTSQAYLSTEAGFHPGIGAQAYLHASSPLRRFVDLVNQYQLLSLVSALSPPFDRDGLESMIPAIEERLRLITEVSRASERYWMLVFLEQKWREVPLDAMFLKKAGKGWQVELLRWNKRIIVQCYDPPSLQMPVKLVITAVDAGEGLCYGDVIS